LLWVRRNKIKMDPGLRRDDEQEVSSY